MKQIQTGSSDLAEAERLPLAKICSDRFNGLLCFSAAPTPEQSSHTRHCMPSARLPCPRSLSVVSNILRPEEVTSHGRSICAEL